MESGSCCNYIGSAIEYMAFAVVVAGQNEAETVYRTIGAARDRCDTLRSKGLAAYIVTLKGKGRAPVVRKVIRWAIVNQDGVVWTSDTLDACKRYSNGAKNVHFVPLTGEYLDYDGQE